MTEKYFILFLFILFSFDSYFVIFISFNLNKFLEHYRFVYITEVDGQTLERNSDVILMYRI